MTYSALFFVLLVQVLGVESAPKEIPSSGLKEYVESGGVLAYHLNVSKCDVNLPKQIPTYSWGDTVYTAIAIGQSSKSYTVQFSVTRAVSGKQYNLTDNAIRFTQVSLMPSEVFVELTDVDEHTPEFLATGSIQCKYDQSGVKLFGQAMTGQQLTTYEDFISHLKMGYDVHYVLRLDMCTPSNKTGLLWGGVIAGYRFSHQGGVEFTQLVDSAQKQYFLTVGVTETEVTVKSYTVFRLTRTQSKTVTSKCHLGKGLQVTVNSDA